MRVLLAHVTLRPAAGEDGGFPVHANALFLTEVWPIPDTPKTLASTSPLPPKSRKIIKNKSQGATPEHRTLQQLNFARCNTTTSHPATLSCCTLQHRAIAPCHFRLSHPATQKVRFCPRNHSVWHPAESAQIRPPSRRQGPISNERIPLNVALKSP